MDIGNKTINGVGPSNARVLWIGESPGPDEEREGSPFVGTNGQEVRFALSSMGISPTEVYFDNVVPKMYHPFPAGQKGYELLSLYQNHLVESRVWKDQRPKLIFACGTWALRRFLNHKLPIIGSTNLSINRWMGSTYLWTSEDEAISLTNRELSPIPIPVGSVIIPVPHPAGYMRDPSRTMRPTFKKFVYRGAEFLKLNPGMWPSRMISTPEIITGFESLPKATRYYIDYEYSPDSGVPFLLGVSIGSKSPVWQTSHLHEMREFYLNNILRDGAIFTAHHVAADLRASFACIGERIFPKRLDDSMLLHHHLEPDLAHDLSFVARHTLSGIYDWKWQSQYQEMYNEYNAKDVQMLAYIWEHLYARAEEFSIKEKIDLLGCYDMESISMIPRIMDMEDVGLRVDEVARAKERNNQMSHIIHAQTTLNETLATAIKQRQIENLKEAIILENEIKTLEEQASLAYTLATGKKLGTRKDLTDDEIILKNTIKSKLKLQVAPMKKELTRRVKLNKELEARGFRLGNDNDTRWYITEVLGVKPKTRTASGALKVDISALETLKDDPVISSIWKAKHAQKLLATFLSVPVDTQGYCHPPIKLHGTATGRPASGRERKADIDKGSNLAFNAFNLPESIRHIFIPDEGHTFINGDIKDLEGRLTALASGDKTLCDLYSQNIDSHSWAAAHIFNIPMDSEGAWLKEVKRDYLKEGSTLVSPRYRTKRVRHGKNYGMGVRKLSQVLKIPVNEATRIASLIDELFPDVCTWQQSIRETVFGVLDHTSPHGRKIWKISPRRYLSTIFGRVRFYPGLEAKVAKECLSQRPQSMGASLWYRIVDRLCEPFSTKLRIGYGRLVIGTYDSFLLSVPSDKVEEASKWLKEECEKPFEELRQLPGGNLMPLSFPLDIKVGSNYGFISDEVTDLIEDDEMEEIEL